MDYLLINNVANNAIGMGYLEIEFEHVVVLLFDIRLFKQAH